jgi:hypothetical protein
MKATRNFVLIIRGNRSEDSVKDVSRLRRKHNSKVFPIEPIRPMFLLQADISLYLMLPASYLGILNLLAALNSF